MRLRTCAFVIIAASSLAFSSAHAADLPASPYPPPAAAPVVYGPMVPGPWTGFYIGGNAGYGWTNTIGDYSLTGNPNTTGTFVGSPVDLDGANGGFQVGYNWQTGNFLIGGEADIQGSGQNQTFNYICGAACTVSQNAKLDWFSTFRGRAGIAIKDVLFYGTGGFAWTHSDNAFSGTFGVIPTSLASIARDSWGWTAGGGVEWMFWYGWSAKVEYLYLGNTAASNIISIPAASGAGTILSTANASDNIVRAGVNYHIGYPIGGGWPSRW
jgi:outer membrane immunogenic protein